ncbi:MBL fold metallo-hydrolase [Salegentibacter sp. F14]
MRHLFAILAFGLFLTGCKNEKREAPQEGKTELKQTSDSDQKDQAQEDINIQPISHATAVITWDQKVFYLDPVGGAEAFEDMEEPGLVLITDNHGDHLNAETLLGLNLENVQIIAPQAVKDELPQELHDKVLVMANGQTKEVMGFSIEAIAMYNLPQDDPESRHKKGRGNGYVIEKNGQRLYISGDTEGVPEMRALEGIDIALVSMNLPYTMSVDQAADAVLEFQPKKVYPYHYRGQDGLADVDKFKNLVNQANEDIKVVQLQWYPDME